MIGRRGGGRWWLGPVFASEALRASRRRTHYAGRSLFVATLLAFMAIVWMSTGGQVVSLEQMARLGWTFFALLTVVQLAVVVLAAPAATAGAICVDKSRGTLLHAFVTDLNGGEIVRGKLAARFLPLVGLLACGLPVLALGGLFGGVDPFMALGAYVVTIATALVACATALAASVWAKKPHQALLLAYALLFVWLAMAPVLVMGPTPTGLVRIGMMSPMAAAIMVANPFYLALMPGIDASIPAWPYQLGFAGACLVVSTGLVGLASWRIRPVTIASANTPRKRGRRGLAAKLLGLLPEPPIDANPVLWREWHRKRPSLWAGRLWTGYTVGSWLVSAGTIALFFLSPDHRMGDLAATVNAGQVAIGLLLLAISSAMSLAEERDRGSLDVILATPLPTATILRGKWLGTFAMVPRLAILPTWIGIALAMVSGQFGVVPLLIAMILAYAAAVTSLGLLMATWIDRPGRAIGASVASYAVILIGGPVVVYSLRSWLAWRMMVRARTLAWTPIPPRLPTVELSLIGPFDGVRSLTEWCGRIMNRGYWSYGDYDGPLTDPTWPIAWIIAYLSIALALFGLTLLIFDRKLGRVRERAIGSIPRPPAEDYAPVIPLPR